MRDLVDTTEMYLRTVYELEEEGITPLRARIAERLEQSGPTVSQTVARMERDGLIVVEHDMAFVRRIARSITVFNQGSVLVEGPARQVLSDPRVRDVYLGKEVA